MHGDGTLACLTLNKTKYFVFDEVCSENIDVNEED